MVNMARKHTFSFVLELQMVFKIEKNNKILTFLDLGPLYFYYSKRNATSL